MNHHGVDCTTPSPITSIILPFNDVAVGCRVLQAHGIQRWPSSIWTSTTATAPRSSRADPRVFTFSMHHHHNYTDLEPRGSLDIASDGTLPTRLSSSIWSGHAARDGEDRNSLLSRRADPDEDDQSAAWGSRTRLRTAGPHGHGTVRRAGSALITWRAATRGTSGHGRNPFCAIERLEIGGGGSDLQSLVLGGGWSLGTGAGNQPQGPSPRPCFFK